MDFEAILKFIQAVIWPIVILIFLFLFSKPLRTLLNSFITILNERGVKLTTTGIEIPSAESNQIENITNEITNPKHLNKILLQNVPETPDEPIASSPDNATTDPKQKYERGLVNDIKNALKNVYEQNKDKLSKEKLYENLLYEAYVSVYFERCFQRILGSQLSLLERLYKTREHSLTKENAELIFNTVYSDVHQNTFERWIEFLIKSDFIQDSGSQYKLSELGIEFFDYILERQYVLHKAG